MRGKTGAGQGERKRREGVGKRREDREGGGGDIGSRERNTQDRSGGRERRRGDMGRKNK